ncbi:MAG: hypothetical protein ACLGXA_24550 [Acidobacteriota bacterium]
MQIEIGPPPRNKSPRRAYSELFRALEQHPGQWVSVPVAEVTGNTKNRKTTSVLSAAAHRGVKVQTQIEGERLYVRVVEGVTVGIDRTGA